VSSDVPASIGVVGAGTMGAGIALVAARSGAPTRLHDPFPGATERGLQTIDGNLDRLVGRQRLTEEEAEAIRARVQPAGSLAELGDCELVIEAAPEDLNIKLELFQGLAGVVDPRCVLATNTSSLSVTEIAAATPIPERVVGMHFFNPVPAMRLMEVVAGEQTGPEALALARAAGEAMGKTVIAAPDVAGFIVNRVNRPYSLESLRLVEQRVASVATVDRIARRAGGFRMGPFELMDLIGIDTNHAVALSFQRQSFGEPRYRPSPLAARKIAAGHLGRKTGRGWYDYGGSSPAPDDGAHPVARVRADGRRVIVAGGLPVARVLVAAARDAGWTVVEPDAADAGAAFLALDCSDGSIALPASVPVARSLHRGSLHAIDPHAAGFHVLSPLGDLVEVTATSISDPVACERLELFFGSLGVDGERVQDAPGLVIGRVVCQVVNEAAFAIGDGYGVPADIDAGMRLGVSHPRGPVEWSDQLGLEHVIAVLDALHRELGEERYRVAPLLRQRAAVGRSLADV
jgi:3-hydroxybutyryl-CoA dehydrogenase